MKVNSCKKFIFLATGLLLSTTGLFAAPKSNSSDRFLLAKGKESRAYANIYTQQAQTIAPNSFFLFEGHTRSEHVNISKAAKTGKLIIKKDGKYAIRYIVMAGDFLGVQMAVTLNGKVVPATKIAENTPAAFLFGFTMSNEVILRLEKNDVLRLKNIGQNSIKIGGVPDSTLAEITVQKL